MFWQVGLGGFRPCKGLCLVISLWQVGPDQSMNSGSGRVSGFSNFFFAKWDVSTGAGQGREGRGMLAGQQSRLGRWQ